MIAIGSQKGDFPTHRTSHTQNKGGIIILLLQVISPEGLHFERFQFIWDNNRNPSDAAQGEVRLPGRYRSNLTHNLLGILVNSTCRADLTYSTKVPVFCQDPSMIASKTLYVC